MSNQETKYLGEKAPPLNSSQIIGDLMRLGLSTEGDWRSEHKRFVASLDEYPSSHGDTQEAQLREIGQAIQADLRAAVGLGRLVRDPEVDHPAIDALRAAAYLAGADTSQRIVLDWMDGALEEAAGFKESIPGFSGPDLVLCLDCHQSGPGRFWAGLDMGCPAGAMGRPDRICWDRLDIRVSDRQAAACAAALHDGVGAVRCKDTAPKIFSPAPLFRFHPHRYQQTRGYSRLVAGFNGRTMSSERFQGVVNALQKEYSERVSDVPRRLSWQQQNTMLVIERETKLFDAYQRFRHNGRAIFDLDTTLVDMLERTSIENVPLDMIRLPYVAQYLHFGQREGWQTRDGWCLTGAYVIEVAEADALEIVLTWSPPTAPDALNWPQVPELVHKQTFEGEVRRMEAGPAIETVFQRRLDALEEEAGVIASERENQVHAMRAELERSGLSPDQISIAPRGRAAHQTDQLLMMQPIAASAMKVVINALLYLTMYPDDRTPAWPDSTPEDLRTQADDITARPSRRKKAKSRLAQLGYQVVYRCGAEIRDAASGTSGRQTGEIGAHWRSGHWRRQPHGPKNSLRYMKWIMPTRVGRLQADQVEADGHIYRTS